MEEGIKQAKKKGWENLYLNASPMGFRGLDLDSLTKFYEKFGFKVIKYDKNNNLMLLNF